MSLLPFDELAEGVVDQRRIFGVRQDLVRSAASGKELRVDRLVCADWVNVVAFDVDDQLLLVRQWRFGTREFSVEVPAGALESGEDPVVGGLRELREETGHTPVDDAAVVLLGATRPNAAFMNNRCFTVFVPRARKTHQQDLDPSEEVEVVRVARSDVNAFVRDGARRCAERLPPTATDTWLDNSLVTVALHLWHLHELAR